MKQFFSFVNKEFYHIFRDGRTMLILLGMPVVQILLFGFAINMEVQNIRTVVFDPAQDVATREIAERMAVNPYFNMRGYVYSPDEVNSLLKQGKIDVAVIFEPNFNENLVHSKRAQIQIITDASNPNTGTISANYVTAIIGEYQKKMLQPGNIPCQIDVDSKLLYNPEMKSAYTFVPGIMGLVDFDLHRSREGTRNNGSTSGIAAEIGNHPYLKNGSIPGAFVHQPDYYPIVVVFCTKRSHSGEFGAAGINIHPVYFPGALTGLIYFHPRTNAGNRRAHFGDWADDAHIDPFGYDFPHR